MQGCRQKLVVGWIEQQKESGRELIPTCDRNFAFYPSLKHTLNRVIFPLSVPPKHIACRLLLDCLPN